MFYFYVLQAETGELYFGSTNDLRRRFKEHNNSKSYATKNHKWKLIYYEAYCAESDARRREQQMKLHGQAKRQLKDRIRASREQS